MHKTHSSAITQTVSYQILRNYVLVVLNKYNLTTIEWAILGHLESNDSLRLSEISKFLHIDPPNVTPIIDQLESKNFAMRCDDPLDRRAKRVVLTAEGEQLVPKVEKTLSAEMNRLLNGVTEGQIATYFKVLQTIIDNNQKMNTQK